MVDVEIQAPGHLSAAQKQLWLRIHEENQIDSAAEPILQIYLESLDRLEEARLNIAKKGRVYEDRFGCPKISPWVAIERDSALIAGRSFRLLGFDQEARGGDQPTLFK